MARGDKHDHAVRRFPAEHLLPGERGDVDFAPIDGLRAQRRRRIDEGETAAVGGNPIAVRHAHARCRAVPGEDHVAIEVDAGEIGQMPVVGRQHARVGRLQLADDVGHPALAEILPGEHVNTALAEHRPQRHLESARVGPGNDGEAVVGGKLEKRMRLVDGEPQPLDAGRRAVRAPKQRRRQHLRRPAGAFGAWPTREVRDSRALLWLIETAHDGGLGGSGHAVNLVAGKTNGAAT